MPSSFRDPKTLADWIQLDYFRRPGRVWRIRNLLTAFIFAACAGLLMALTWWPRTHFVYQSRPVSSAHTMFNHRCDVCHVESFQPAVRLLRSDPEIRSVSDSTCRECHPVGPHHQECVADPSCSACHQEHRGRPVLARVADSHCTDCHSDLDALGCPTMFATKINQFSVDHPAFGAWQQAGLVDPGTIRFNHKVHLSLKPESVRGIEAPLAALREQQCNYCHKPDPAGRYLLPINYDQHCSQCHPLSVAVAGSWEKQDVRAAAERFAQQPAPHKDPWTVRAALRERYTRFVQDHPGVLGSQQPAEPPRWIPSGPRCAAGNGQGMALGKRTAPNGRAPGFRRCQRLPLLPQGGRGSRTGQSPTVLAVEHYDPLVSAQSLQPRAAPHAELYRVPCTGSFQ